MNALDSRGKNRLRPKLNWRKAFILTALALIVGISLLVGGLETEGGKQILLLASGAVSMFLFFAGIYVTLVRRYYYRQQ